ncbi:hypothetical protein, partial [Candidatus Binatus sp.]
LKWLGLVKTQAQAAQQRIDKILADKTDPYHDKDADFHDDRVQTMIDLKAVAAGIKKRKSPDDSQM